MISSPVLTTNLECSSAIGTEPAPSIRTQILSLEILMFLHESQQKHLLQNQPAQDRVAYQRNCCDSRRNLLLERARTSTPISKTTYSRTEMHAVWWTTFVA